MCAILYKDVNLEVAGAPVPDVTATYIWQGNTTYGGEDFDYWFNTANGFTAWYLGALASYILADTFPAAPGPGDDWWRADKPGPISVYYANGTAADQAHTYPLEPDLTEWQQWGQHQPWLVRSNATKKMHGQAFYPRTTYPARYAALAIWPNVAPDSTPPPIDDVRCQFNPAFNWASFELHFTQAYTGTIYNGLSIFQIRPASRGKTWELRHTAIVATYDELQVVLPAWADYPFDLAWPCPTISHLRVFARVWNKTAFLNFGPLTAQAF